MRYLSLTDRDYQKVLVRIEDISLVESYDGYGAKSRVTLGSGNVYYFRESLDKILSLLQEVQEGS